MMDMGRKKLFDTAIHVRISRILEKNIVKDAKEYGSKGEVVRNILKNHYGLNNLNSEYKN